MNDQRTKFYLPPPLTGLLLIFFAWTQSLSAKVAIAQRGKAVALVVVASDASEVEQEAGRELAFFLHIVTGADFSVVSTAGPGQSRLLVGEGAARMAQPDFRASDLGPEEIIIQVQGHDLVLAGGSPRATFYAVFTFLEDVVGCRWWTPVAWHIPWKRTLTLKPVSIRYQPPLEYREPFWLIAFDPVWAGWMKANGIRAGADDLHGGRHIYEGFVHTFYSLIPPEKYFANHPEWFSEIDGRRIHQNGQLCLTNEEMRRELVKNLKERLRLNPQATIASVSQNDCFNYCTCARCRAVDEEEGGPSGSLLRFINAVAADIEGEFPHVAIDTLAYQYTRRPPRLTRPRSNVIIRLCSIECSFSRPLEDPRNQAFLDDLRGWSRLTDRLYVWDYTTNFAHYIQPHPNYQVLASNIRLFVRHHVRGIFEQGAYQSWGAEMAELRAWLLAKLLWNPSLDPARLRQEFLKGYYGPMARDVARFLSLLEQAVFKSGDDLGCYSPPDAKFMTLETMLKAWGILKKAEKKAGKIFEYQKRIRRVQMPIAYVVLARWEAFRKEARDQGWPWPWPEEREQLLDWFLQVARAEGITMISEWQTLDDWAAKGGRSQ
ncbi:MAG: DUF4838 domain-containing protein [Candidatus Aminicenantales bacterium]